MTRGCVGLLFLITTPLLAQENSDVQARRLLEDGRAYWTQGKLKQALDNFNIIVSSFSGTSARSTAWVRSFPSRR